MLGVCTVQANSIGILNALVFHGSDNTQGTQD